MRPFPHQENRHSTADDKTLSSLYKRDNGRCRLCGVALPKVYLTIDYVIPPERGGSDHENNLQLVCDPCFLRKGRMTLYEYAEWLRVNDPEAYKRLLAAQDSKRQGGSRNRWHLW